VRREPTSRVDRGTAGVEASDAFLHRQAEVDTLDDDDKVWGAEEVAEEEEEEEDAQVRLPPDEASLQSRWKPTTTVMLLFRCVRLLQEEATAPLVEFLSARM
jgi:hypothetical protein